MFRFLLVLIFKLVFLCIANRALGIFSIVQDSEPSCLVVVPENSSEQERFAVEELNYFFEKFTGVKLKEKPDSEPLSEDNVILIGTFDNNKYINKFLDNGLISRGLNPSEDEFVIKFIREQGRNFLVVASESGRGVIYSAYALIEKCLEKLTGLDPVDLDFHVRKVTTLDIGALNIRSAPFYPIRCSLSQEDPLWMSRHRINVSGAEGVWSGTGIDDGLGTAFKYVYDPQFDDMQDEPFPQRWNRISELQKRLRELQTRGIEPYLFMYVMGEPTKAMMENHPELLEDTVMYPHSRNNEWYKPISWTNPSARALIKELVKSIVRTYSPWLKGFHLRSWGGETRAPAGNDKRQQELLWEIYFDIINSAREIDPEFKFIISGYDEYWLKDPDRIHIAKLPKGTILMRKWGIDGEPTNDPEIDPSLLFAINKFGHKLLVLSHDVEEVMPLWMLEADMFVEGVRKYAENPKVSGLGGFTLQGEIGLAHLDKIVSARIAWDPGLDYVALMKNYLITHYGIESAQLLLQALRDNSAVLADYFSDYAGSLSLTGRYGNGSRGYAVRFWNIIGKDAVRDTLSIPDSNTVEYAKERFASLLPKQQGSANKMVKAKELIQPSSAQAEQDYLDSMHMMKMWVRFFESRSRLVEAREYGLLGDDAEKVTQKLSSAVEYSKEMQVEISEIGRFVHVFGYDNESAKRSLITTIDEEIDFLKSLDPKSIIVVQHSEEGGGEADLSIADHLVHPNPTNGTATFCYNLTSNADEVTITIYTVTGRRVRTITSASAKSGYNEEVWDAKDEDRTPLASGTYFYRLVAKRGNKKVQTIGKLSIIR